MANIPYGYHKNMEVNGRAVIIGHANYKDDAEIYSFSDFVKGFIAAEINCMQEMLVEKRKELPELTVPDLIENTETKAILRQQIVNRDMEEFYHMVFAETLRLVQGKMKGCVEKFKGLVCKCN